MQSDNEFYSSRNAGDGVLLPIYHAGSYFKLSKKRDQMNRGTISVVAAVSSWVVIICGGAFSFFQVIYPELKEASRIQSENNYLKEQIIQLKEDKRSIHTSLNELISSSSSQSIEAFQAKERIAQCSLQLAQANERITSLTDQANRLGAVVETSKRCAPFVEQINELQKEMAGRTFEAMGKPPSAERRAELGSLIAQQQVTLQTCLSMRP